MRLREIGLNTGQSEVNAKSTVFDNTQPWIIIGCLLCKSCLKANVVPIPVTTQGKAKLEQETIRFYHLIMRIINAAISALFPIFLHFAEVVSVFETYFCNMAR